MANNLLDHFISKPIDRSLRAKITLMLILPISLILATFMISDYMHHRSVLVNKLSKMASYNGQLISEALQHSMQESDFSEMQLILDAVGKNKIIRTIYLLDNSGKVIFAPNSVNKGIQLDKNSPDCLSCHNLPVNERPSGIVINNDGQQVFRSMQPISNSPACSQCHDPKQDVIGALFIDISAAPINSAVISDLKENLLMGGITILVLVIIVNLVMSRLVIQRLKKVAKALSSFGSGKRDLQLASSSMDEIGQLEADFNHMEQQIQVKEDENRRISDELCRQSNQREELLKQLITAQEDERNRVAHELHDELGQALSGLALHSQVIERLIKDDPERALTQLAVSREIIEKTTEQMHELILALRPSVLDHLGLVAAVHAHADRLFKDSEVTFKLDSTKLQQRLPASIETALYRTFQEALSNVVKHSQADQVTIKLSRLDGWFEGEIVDNGVGFNPEKIACTGVHVRGIGLLGMQERITQCGGTFDLYSAIGEGTRIQIRIPILEGEHE